MLARYVYEGSGAAVVSQALLACLHPFFSFLLLLTLWLTLALEGLFGDWVCPSSTRAAALTLPSPLPSSHPPSIPTTTTNRCNETPTSYASARSWTCARG